MTSDGWRGVKRATPPGASLLVYDHTCCFCQRCMQLVTMLDWRDRFAPMRFDEAQERFADIRANGIEEGVRLRSDAGELLSMRAVQAVMLGLPLLRPIALLLDVRPIYSLAERAYAVVSRHRHQIPCR